MVSNTDKCVQYTKKFLVYRGTFSESDSVSDLKRRGRGCVWVDGGDVWKWVGRGGF